MSVAGTSLLAQPLGSAAYQAFAKQNDVAMKVMMKDMHVASSGDVDRDFIAMMIPHHQGAVDMARAQLSYGRNEQLKRLSRAIIAKQQAEIAEMRRITAKLGPRPARARAAAPMQAEGHRAEHHH